MNICQFFIEAHTKKSSKIKDLFIRDFVKNSSNQRTFISDCENIWRNIGTNLQSLYNVSNIVIAGSRQGVEYYIFDTNQTESGSKDKITFDIVVKSEIEIDESINIAIKDIKNIFKNGKIKTLKNNRIYLYPYNISRDDIYDPTHKIRAEFKIKKLTISEKIRIFIFSVITFFTGSLILINLDKIGERPIEISVFGSTIVFLISEILIKLLPRLSWKLHVSISNLSDFIQPNPLQVPFEEEQNLINPPEGDNL